MTRRQAGNIPEAALPGLHRYCDLIRHWTSRINLVAPSTLDDLWERHVLDSVQLFHVKQDFGDHYADLGSGAGLPGLVIAHLLRSTGRNCQINAATLAMLATASGSSATSAAAASLSEA